MMMMMMKDNEWLKDLSTSGWDVFELYVFIQVFGESAQLNILNAAFERCLSYTSVTHTHARSRPSHTDRPHTAHTQDHFTQTCMHGLAITSADLAEILAYFRLKGANLSELRSSICWLSAGLLSVCDISHVSSVRYIVKVVLSIYKRRTVCLTALWLT